MCGVQSVFSSDNTGGWRPELLAQRSIWSMTFSWLGRRGLGECGSSESLRGSLTLSVMASSIDQKMGSDGTQVKELRYCFYL